MTTRPILSQNHSSTQEMVEMVELVEFDFDLCFDYEYAWTGYCGC